MSRRAAARYALPLLASLVLGACDPVLGPDAAEAHRPVVYGELVSQDLSSVPEQSRMGLLKLYGDGLMLGSFVGYPDDLMLEPGGFPSRFALDLFVEAPLLGTAPPTGPLEGAGWLMLIAVGRQGHSAYLPDDEHLLGVSEGHVVAYLVQDVVAGSPQAALLGGPLSRGFHLLRVLHKTPEQAEAIRTCRDTAPV